jgi:hypothetical protein
MYGYGISQNYACLVYILHFAWIGVLCVIVLYTMFKVLTCHVVNGGGIITMGGINACGVVIQCVN